MIYSFKAYVEASDDKEELSFNFRNFLDDFYSVGNNGKYDLIKDEPSIIPSYCDKGYYITMVAGIHFYAHILK